MNWWRLRLRPDQAMCILGAAEMLWCGITAPRCIAAGHGPRTRHARSCARRYRPARQTASNACVRHRARLRN